MRTRLTLAAAAAAAALALTGCGSSNADTTATPTAAATTATPTIAAPTTPPALYDEETACRKAIRLVADATTDLIGEIVDHPDGSTIDTILLASTIRQMREVQPSMPEELGADLGDLIEPLEALQRVLTTGNNETINTGIYRSRGPGLIIGCGPYIGA